MAIPETTEGLIWAVKAALSNATDGNYLVRENGREKLVELVPILLSKYTDLIYGIKEERMITFSPSQEGNFINEALDMLKDGDDSMK